MKLDARTIAAAVLVNIAAAIVAAYLMRRFPALRQLTEGAP